MKEKVRPLIAILMTGGLIAGFFLKLVSPEAFIGIASVAITWFFKTRDEEKK